MEILNNLDPGLLIVVCGLLCVVGFVGLIIVSLLSGVLDIFTALLGVFGDIAMGGPFAWCGCLVFLFGCGICGGVTFAIYNVITTCGTPDAVNFCRLF